MFSDFHETAAHVGIKCPRPRWSLDQHGGAQRILIHSSLAAGGALLRSGLRRTAPALCGADGTAARPRTFRRWSSLFVLPFFFTSVSEVRSLYTLPRCLVWRPGSELFQLRSKTTGARLGTKKKKYAQVGRTRDEAFQQHAGNHSEVAACACTTLALLRIH